MSRALRGDAGGSFGGGVISGALRSGSRSSGNVERESISMFILIYVHPKA
jgi:hypothetical protein